MVQGVPLPGLQRFHAHNGVTHIRTGDRLSNPSLGSLLDKII